MSEGTEFEIGDAVRLRVDGSPGMVVEAIEADGRLLCGWTDGAGSAKSQAFPPRALRAYEFASPTTEPAADA